MITLNLFQLLGLGIAAFVTGLFVGRLVDNEL